MSYKRAVVFVFASAVVLACSDWHTPSAPLEPDLAFDVAVEPAGASGIAGFHFLPPVVKEGTQSVNFDRTLLDMLAIEICEWNGTTCSSLVRRITPQDALPARLRVSEDAYHAVWQTLSDELDPAKTYRIRVLASGGELGHIDVDVVDPGEAPAPEPTNHLRVVRGSAQPIKFFVEEGAGVRIGDEGGIVNLADGALQLRLPPGALPQDVFLTSAPASNLPTNGPPIVAGTAWDMGPDGLVFNTPVTLTISYDPADIPAGVNEAELRIHKFVNGQFEQQDAGVVDLVNHTVSAEVDGFSVFVVIPRDPQNPQDINGPVVRSMQVFNPATSGFAPTATLDVSTGDASLVMRFEITDDITGAVRVVASMLSPTGRQVRFPCWFTFALTSGSDTNGVWECRTTFPQHAESGTWRWRSLIITDRVGNGSGHSVGPAGLCKLGTTVCVNPAEVIITSSTADLDPPGLHSIDVSNNVIPRAFSSSVTVDVSAAAQVVFFRFRATDNLTGVGNFIELDNFTLSFTGPLNQTVFGQSCNLTGGTRLDGVWECPVVVPVRAQTGTWRLSRIRVPDRAGNGGFSAFADFVPNGAGQLCNSGSCVTSPTVNVIGSADAEPPAIQSVTITENQPTVTTSFGVTDNLSGVASVLVRYTHVGTGQSLDCNASLTSGTTTNGTWSCNITFSQFAALGQWIMSVFVRDAAGHLRSYNRRPTDGFLCYNDPSFGGLVCRDFGDTDLILQ